LKERHLNNKIYFNEQSYTCHTHIIPIIEKHKYLGRGTKVLEVGCGFGGNLRPFLDLGCQVTGVDILESSIERAKIELNIEGRNNLELITSDIYDIDYFKQQFDVIIMKDTLEHIPNQELFLSLLETFLKSNGVIFQGFPPWHNPFGGHQQMCKSKVLSKLPWFHISPRFLYKNVLKIFGETSIKIKHLLEDVYDTRITIQQFKKMVKKGNLKIVSEQLYFINPNYEIKFNLKPKKVLTILSIPYLRDFYTTTAYYILKKNKSI